MAESFREQIRKGTSGTPGQSFTLGDPPAVPSAAKQGSIAPDESPATSETSGDPSWGRLAKALGQAGLMIGVVAAGAALLATGESRRRDSSARRADRPKNPSVYRL